MSAAGRTRAEFTKFFTTAAWWVLGVVLVGYLALMGAGVGFVGDSIAPVLGSGALGDLSLGPLIYGLAGSIGYAFPLIVGVLIVTSEFRHRTLTTTLLATPRRGSVLTSKLVAGGVIGLGYGVLAVIAVTLPAAGILTAFGHDAGLTDVGTWALFGRVLIAYALWTLIGVGLGSLIPNQVVAIVIVLAFTQFIEPMLRIGGSFVEWLDGVTRYLPGAASDALVGSSFFSLMSQSADGQLPWWGGALVLAVFAAILVLIGGLTTWRRDVD